jgi:hypothetical protein
MAVPQWKRMHSGRSVYFLSVRASFVLLDAIHGAQAHLVVGHRVVAQQVARDPHVIRPVGRLRDVGRVARLPARLPEVLGGRRERVDEDLVVVGAHVHVAERTVLRPDDEPTVLGDESELEPINFLPLEAGRALGGEPRGDLAEQVLDCVLVRHGGCLEARVHLVVQRMRRAQARIASARVGAGRVARGAGVAA